MVGGDKEKTHLLEGEQKQQQQQQHYDCMFCLPYKVVHLSLRKEIFSRELLNIEITFSCFYLDIILFYCDTKDIILVHNHSQDNL